MTSSTPSPGPLGPAARLPYDDLARISDMGADCEAAGRALSGPARRAYNDAYLEAYYEAATEALVNFTGDVGATGGAP